MEESCFISSIRILYQSSTVPNLQAELYDFSDNLLEAIHLLDGKGANLPIQTQLRSFYFRMINIEMEISELFSYFWPEGSVKKETVNVTQSYDNFIIKIQITIRERLSLVQPFQLVVTPPLEQIDPHQYLLSIKQKVFKTLQGQNFFLNENERSKGIFVRKKNHKNMTAILINNSSSNILKRINQNFQNSLLKTYNNFKTTDTNDTAEEINVDPFPPIDIMKKTNSMQDPTIKNESKSNTRILAFKNEAFNGKEQQPHKEENKRTMLKRKALPILRGKKEYEKALQQQTVFDLRNQKETLNIIHSYIAEKVGRPKDPKTTFELELLSPKKTKTKQRLLKKSRVNPQKRSNIK